MTAEAGNPCRFHAGGARADHQNRLRSRSGFDFQLALSPRFRVDGTGYGIVGRELIAAAHAGRADADILHPPLFRLQRPVWIGMQRPPERNEIRLARRQDLFGEFRMVDPSHDRNGDLHTLLDPPAVFDETPPGIGHRLSDPSDRFIDPGRDVDKIDARSFQLDGKVDRILHGNSAFQLLIGTHPVGDGHVISHHAAHLGNCFQGETHAILEGTAVPIRPLVAEGREELADDVAVSAVDHDDVKTRLYCPARCLSVQLDLLPDLCQGQFFRNVPARQNLAWHVRRRDRLPAGDVRRGFPSRRIQMSGHLGAVRVHRIGHPLQARNHSVVMDPQLPDVAPPDRVDVDRLRVDQTDASLGPFHHVVDIPLGDRPVGVCIVPFTGSTDETIFEGDPSERVRFKKVLEVHFSLPSSMAGLEWGHHSLSKISPCCRTRRRAPAPTVCLPGSAG